MKLTKSEQKTIEFYNQNARSYALKIQNKIPKNQITKFVNLLNSPYRVLDIGCAAGRDSRELKLLGCTVTGIDMSAGLLKIAKDLDKVSKYIQKDMREIDLKKNSFEGVYAAASLIHLPTLVDVEMVLEKFSYILSDKGVLYLSIKEQLLDKKTEIVYEERSNHLPRFFQFFTKQEISKTLLSNNFKVLEINKRKSSRGNQVSWLDIYCKKTSLNL